MTGWKKHMRLSGWAYLSAAFDIIDDKLNCFEPSPAAWIQGYFTNRKYTVDFDGRY